MGKTEENAAAKKNYREEQRLYEQRKGWAIKYEKTNYTTVMLFRSVKKKEGDGKWWKMGGHSMEIYTGKLAPRLKIKPRVTADTDFHDKFREGIVSIRAIENFEKKMESLGIHRNTKRSTDGVMIFDLGYTVKEEDLKKIRKADEERLKQLHALVDVKVIAPEINVGLSTVMRTLKHKYDKMSVTDREFLGDKLIAHVRRAMIIYMSMTMGEVNEAKGLHEIITEVNILICYIALAGEYRIIDLGACTRMDAELVKARRIANAKLTGGDGFEEEMAGAEMREKMGLNKKMK